MSAKESSLNRSDNLFRGAVGFHSAACFIQTAASSDMEDGAV